MWRWLNDTVASGISLCGAGGQSNSYFILPDGEFLIIPSCGPTRSQIFCPLNTSLGYSANYKLIGSHSWTVSESVCRFARKS